jgi:hypothetical protein
LVKNEAEKNDSPIKSEAAEAAAKAVEDAKSANTTLKVSSTSSPVTSMAGTSAQPVVANNGASSPADQTNNITPMAPMVTASLDKNGDGNNNKSSPADQTNNITPTTPIVTASLDKNGDGNNNKSSIGQTSPAEVKTITASIQPNVNELTAQFANVNGEYVDNKVISGSSGSTVLADNSKQINIINNNNDGLMVETLVGVREYERSFENTIKQNLRMV